jgi:hypothetical protein
MDEEKEKETKKEEKEPEIKPERTPPKFQEGIINLNDEIERKKKS